MSDITVTHPHHPGVTKTVQASALAVYEANGWVREPDPPKTTRKTTRKTTKRPDGANPKEQS